MKTLINTIILITFFCTQILASNPQNFSGVISNIFDGYSFEQIVFWEKTTNTLWAENPVAPWGWKQQSKANSVAFTASTTQSEIPNFESKSSTETQQETVIICRGEHATKYHSTSSCRGLNNCKGGISEASKSHAIGSGKSSCSICYKDYQPSSNNYQRSTTPQNKATSVIICGGQHATKYHRSTSCRGLNNCKKGLYEISKNGAINRGKSPCSICY